MEVIVWKRNISHDNLSTPKLLKAVTKTTVDY